jgi:hypothetical protein
MLTIIRPFGGGVHKKVECSLMGSIIGTKIITQFSVNTRNN